ncbi:MAG: peptide-methionine (S)-S-oxide reductase MsrA [Cellulomonadaceae bacterium]|jgi:methionine-S-sulfoxide reductase|nr:peptide-methionine (S)-S-oxide reductase MsrA [Cellulomonadaceae bacterium]
MSLKEIVLAGGCFWGVEKYFAAIKGVTHTDVGYANGVTADPTYREVCTGNTGFAEAVRIQYDNDIVTLPFLLEMYYQVIDPTSQNKQGNDVGTQYRTGIYYSDDSDLPAVQLSLAALQQRIGKPLAIEVQPLQNYYLAEEYHQEYLGKNPGGYCHIPSSAFQRAAVATDPAVG